MPSRSPRSTRAIADSSYTRDHDCHMERIADGHRAYPRYPDGRDFELKSDPNDPCDDTPSKHLSLIRDYREDFGI